MEYRCLTIERDGPVATITLNRPEKLNALSLSLLEELEQAALAFREDEATRAVIITGAGKHFSAGADLNDPERERRMKGSKVMQWRALRIGPRVARAIYDMNQITIAALHGVALGGGAVIATACDFRIGSDDCFVGYPEIKRGMNLSWYGVPLCVNLIGPARAKRMIILGEQENAETLLSWGFLDQLVEREHLINAARELARKYAALPPLQAQMIKRSINAVSSALDQAIMHMDTDQFMLAMQTEDAREAMKAFFEKRAPEFRGN